MMKLFVILFEILLFTSILLPQTYYIDASGGNDSNNGTSPSSAWKTISKINSFNFNTSSGNVYVKFKRDQIWRETLAPNDGGTGENNRIIFTSYGTGRRPQILGSNDLKVSAASWTDMGSNIWRRSLSSNPYYVIFEKPNTATHWGYRQNSSTACNSDYRFYWSSNYLYVYATSNPNDYYRMIEVPTRYFAVGEITTQYITLDSLELWGSREACVRTSNGHYLTIQNCDIHHVGNVSVGDGGEGDLLYIVSSNAVVRNNKIWEPGSHGIYQGMYNGYVGRNCIYEGNYIANCYYTMIDIQHTGNAGSTYGNAGGHIIRNNYLIGDSMAQGSIYNGAGAGIQVLGMRENGNNEWMKDVKIYNNVLVGMEWGINWTRVCDSIQVYNNTFIDTDILMRETREDGWPGVSGYYTPPTKIWWKNNIVYRGSGTLIQVSNDTNKVWDNNVWYSGTTNAFYGGGTSRSFTQWKQWTGDDANSVFANPLFVQYTNKSSYKDLRLQPNSPALNIGASLGNPYNIDILGISRPQGAGYDAGAYELAVGSGGDVTQPQVISATIINSTTLAVNFSEALNNATAQNKNNYSINNGITVSSAVLSGSQVTLTTSTHVSGAYTVTINNVTDLAGNLTNPNFNTANYNYIVADLIPPQVVSAASINSTKLVINFSEALTSSTAQNKNNYLINNGITVSSAVLSGTQVTLTTSTHISGSYNITVNNVTDLANNVVDPQHNSATYEYQTSSGLLKFSVEQVVASVTPEPTHTGEKTIDGKGLNQGDPDSRWAGDTMPEWLVYDLGSVNMLTTTKMSFFKWDESRIYNYSIQVSTDNVNWTAVRTNIVSLPQEWSQETVAPINARYIKITFISNNLNSWAGLWEAEFWGNNSTDVTPPQILSAALTNPTKLVINFSETLNNSNAQNKSNYLISNGITVSSAVLSGTQVILTTSAHSTGSYTVTVNNVTDPAGNIINPLYKTANYLSAIDNVRPYFTGLTVTSSTSLTVKFSEKLDPVKAKNKNNYSINKNIVIYSVQLLPDSMSIKLNTSYHSKYKDYTLTISNITDRAGNIISPNPKSVIYRRTNSGTTSPIQNPIEGAISNDWHPNYLPEKTIDGTGMINPDSRWMSSTIMPDTLCLDMGNVYTMDSLRISFYQWNTDRLYKYSMLSSIDSLIWEPVVSDIWSDSLEWTNIEFDSTQARFVKLILLESNQNQPASIWEIELYGPAGVTGINNETEIPNAYTLSQNYPNPFNPTTTISYKLPERMYVSLKIYDIIGNEVDELVNESQNSGNYSINFNASNLSSGVYFYRIQAGEFVYTRKMLLLK